MTQPAIEVRGLRRSFGVRRALDGVDFTLGPGECLALFGPNGAGKTTLLRVLAGLLKPSGGSARIAGVAVPGGAEVRGAVGLISHATMLYGALTARENVEFAARMHGVKEPRFAARAALERMRVHDRAEAPVRSLSRGLQQRVSVARATVHTPSVVLLDEPFTGLDDTGAAALTTVLATLREQGATLVLVTHNIAEGLALASHAAVMKEGRFLRFEECREVHAPSFVGTYRELLARGA
ncbi:MAG TPA: heme ABC exporter ATP-binding protein CcmA [Gemmatimonadaceae bacterium]|nr:heme ABC exporter ATP-binding protein CcmA [Gemmatimonadaceae bacterium]